MHRGNPLDRNPGGARAPNIKQTLRFLQPIGLDVGSQQGELDQVVLCAAAANAFVLARQRRQRLDRAREILPLERRKAARQCGKVSARGVTPLARQFLHLPGTGIERGIIPMTAWASMTWRSASPLPGRGNA